MKRTLTLSTIALLLLASPSFAQGNPGAHFVENFDINGDGQVTLAEVQEKRGEIFYMLDQDEDGTLSGAEYDLFDETRAADHEQENADGNGHGNGDQGEGMAREETDLNGNGEVTEQEFLDATQAWFTRKDRNNDGVITTADFGPRG